MKSYIVLGLSFVLSACSTLVQPVSWKYVQNVGGMAVGDPYRISDNWMLPVTVDVSGLQRVTSEPQVLDSSRICKDTYAKVKGDSIYLTIYTTFAAGEGSSNCPDSNLGHMLDGEYSVYYNGPENVPVFIGVVLVSHKK